MPAAPHDVDDSLTRALSIDPDARPRDAASWTEALAIALEAMPETGSAWPRPLVTIEAAQNDTKQLATLPSRRPVV
jgi:hypothetical protein